MQKNQIKLFACHDFQAYVTTHQNLIFCAIHSIHLLGFVFEATADHVAKSAGFVRPGASLGIFLGNDGYGTCFKGDFSPQSGMSLL